MKSLYHEFHDKYSQKAKLFTDKRKMDIIYKHESEFKVAIGLKDENTINLLAMKYKSIIDRFVFGNSFVGNEIMMIRYFLYQITIWNSIAVYEELDEPKILMCGNEIEILFYSFLNIVYNFKDKIQKFVLFNKGNKTENGKSILTEETKTKIKKLFKDEYKNISLLCESRRYLVHDSFAMHYDNQQQVIHFSAMDFDLSIRNLYEKTPYLIHYSIKEPDLDIFLQSIERILYGTVDILSDFNCMNPLLFKEKFSTMENGRKGMKITF